MTKYRIRLESGRVIGPFSKNQLFELKTKGHIKGNEEAQVFPMGNWGPLNGFDFYADLMDENKTIVKSETTSEDTFVIDLTKIRNQQIEKELEAYDQGTIAAVEELTETVRMPSTSKTPPPAEPTESLVLEDPNDLVLTPKTTIVKLDELRSSDNDDKTLINPIAQQELERMRRQEKAEEEKRLAEEEQKDKEAQEKAAEEMALVVAAKQEIVSSDEATQVLNLDRTGLLKNAFDSEVEIAKELQAVLVKKAKDKKAAEVEEEDENEEENTAKAKKKKIVIVIAALAIIYALLFPEEKEKKPTFQHIEPRIIFPIPFDRADVQKSKAEYNRGIEHLKKGTYPDLVRAGLNFKASYENDLNNSAALNLLVRTYAEELIHSNNKTVDAQTLFNIIQSKRPSLIVDPNGVIGLNRFYMAINKQAAAADVIQKYLKLNPKNVTQDIFAVNLSTLIKQGRIDLARQFFEALDKAPDKNRYTYAALIEYLLLNQEMKKQWSMWMMRLNEILRSSPLP